MARIEIANGMLTVVVDGLARVATPRHQVEVSLAHILGVTARAEARTGLLAYLRTLSSPGTHIPGLLRAGTFMDKDGRVFYAIRHGTRAVVIDLERESFRRLIVEPPEGETPEGCAARIRAAAQSARAILPPV
ncbi:MAG: hypothetical protein ACRDHE_12585 [Ktedonobacterales bacterium]